MILLQLNKLHLSEIDRALDTGTHIYTYGLVPDIQEIWEADANASDNATGEHIESLMDKITRIIEDILYIGIYIK